jgi:hypothetical protein
MGKVACPSTSQCTAITQDGEEVTFNPTGPGSVDPTTVDAGIAFGYSVSGVACPSTSQCTVTDGAGREVTFSPSVPGTPTPTTIDTGSELVGMACPSRAQCTALSVGSEVTFNPNAPRPPAPATIDSGHSLIGLACPSSRQCTALDKEGQELTFNPNAPGSPTHTTIDPSAIATGGMLINPLSGSIACPSTSQCTAVDNDGREITFNPSAPGGRTSITVDTRGLSEVECPSTSQCTAFGEGREITFNPSAPGTPTPTTIFPHTGQDVTGAACPSTGQCTAVDDVGLEVTFDPRAPGTVTPTTIDTGTELTGVACPSIRQCTAIDHYGRAVEGNPQRVRTWTLQPIGNANALRAIACSSTAQCVAGDRVGNAFVGWPFAASVTHATVGGNQATVRISCTGLVGSYCRAALQLFVVEKLGGSRVIAVGAAKDLRGGRERTVTLARQTVRIRAGHSTIAKVALNATGRALLRARHKLSATLVIKQARPRPDVSQTLEFGVPKHRRQ